MRVIVKKPSKIINAPSQILIKYGRIYTSIRTKPAITAGGAGTVINSGGMGLRKQDSIHNE